MGTGIKYILVVPINNTVKNIRHTVEWTTKLSISKIKKNMPIFGSVQYGDHYSLYKYAVIEETESYTVSLTFLSGDPNLIASINSSSPIPTREITLITLRLIEAILFLLKDLILSTRIHGVKLLIRQRSDLSLVKHISIYCSPSSTPFINDIDSCAYFLKVYADNEMIHMLVDCVPQNDSVVHTKNLY